MVNKMANVRWEHYPHVVSNELARAWLVLESNLGLAANTLDAYGRALQDYLAFSADQNTPVITATKDHIAEYVRHLTRGHLGGFRPHVDALRRLAVPTERS